MTADIPTEISVYKVETVSGGEAISSPKANVDGSWPINGDAVDGAAELVFYLASDKRPLENGVLPSGHKVDSSENGASKPKNCAVWEEVDGNGGFVKRKCNGDCLSDEFGQDDERSFSENGHVSVFGADSNEEMVVNHEEKHKSFVLEENNVFTGNKGHDSVVSADVEYSEVEKAANHKEPKLVVSEKNDVLTGDEECAAFVPANDKDSFRIVESEEKAEKGTERIREAGDSEFALKVAEKHESEEKELEAGEERGESTVESIETNIEGVESSNAPIVVDEEAACHIFEFKLEKPGRDPSETALDEAEPSDAASFVIHEYLVGEVDHDPEKFLLREDAALEIQVEASKTSQYANAEARKAESTIVASVVQEIDCVEQIQAQEETSQSETEYHGFSVDGSAIQKEKVPSLLMLIGCAEDIEAVIVNRDVENISFDVVSPSSVYVEPSVLVLPLEGKAGNAVPVIASEEKNMKLTSSSEEMNTRLSSSEAAEGNEVSKSKNKKKKKKASSSSSSSSKAMAERIDLVEENNLAKEEEEAKHIEEEQSRIDEKLRREKLEADLKEQLRLEHIAKSREGEERKRKKVEKAQAKADVRAQKEAELKEKRKAKKDRKKASPTEAQDHNCGTDGAASCGSRTIEPPTAALTRESEVGVAVLSRKSSRMLPVMASLDSSCPVSHCFALCL